MGKRQQAAEAQAEVQAEDYAEVATDGLQGSETLAEEGQESGAEGEGQSEEVGQTEAVASAPKAKKKRGEAVFSEVPEGYRPPAPKETTQSKAEGLEVNGAFAVSNLTREAVNRAVKQAEKAHEGRKYIISDEGGRFIVFRKN